MNQLRDLSTSGVKLYSPKRKTNLHVMQFNFQWYLFFYFCDAVHTIRSFKKISNLVWRPKITGKCANYVVCNWTFVLVVRSRLKSRKVLKVNLLVILTWINIDIMPLVHFAYSILLNSNSSVYWIIDNKINGLETQVKSLMLLMLHSWYGLIRFTLGPRISTLNIFQD